MNQAIFAAPVGLTQASISEMEHGRYVASVPIMLAIEHVHGVSRSWLDTGDGPMFVKGTRARIEEMEVPELKIVSQHDFSVTDERAQDFRLVPLLTVEAAAGSPQVVELEHVEGYAIVPTRWARGRQVAIRVHGDSMAPLLGDGDVVGVDRAQRDPRELRERIVAAVVDDGLTVKRLLAAGPATWILQPENRQYPPVAIAARDLKLIGRVVWWTHREE